MKIDLPDNSSACMIAFFIYQDRCYVAYNTVSPTPGLMGNFLGTATGSILVGEF